MAGDKVLVLDDEENLRSTLVEFLADQGYEVSCAPDSCSGVRLAAVHSPDIILLDLNMPRVSGLDAIPALHSVSPNAKIIVITGKTGHELAARTLKSGAIDFLSKPLDYEALGRSLTRARAITYPSA
jgi:two-component system, NtrC family, response regulator HydG